MKEHLLSLCFPVVSPAYSFSWINSCKIPGGGRTEVPAHPGEPERSHWGAEKRERKNCEAIWTPGVIFRREFKCWFTYVAPNCDCRGAYEPVAVGAWEAPSHTLCWIHRMDIEEKKLLSTCLIWQRVSHHEHCSQHAVGQKAASEVCVHSLTERGWCFLETNRLLILM